MELIDQWRRKIKIIKNYDVYLRANGKDLGAGRAGRRILEDVLRCIGKGFSVEQRSETRSHPCRGQQEALPCSGEQACGRSNLLF